MPTPDKKPVIFLTFANDRSDGNRYLGSLPEEARQLRAVLAPLTKANRCTLEIRQNVTIEEVLNFFQDGDYRDQVVIYHFGGHSDSLQLMLEERDGKPAPVSAEGLAAFLGQQKGLKLIFLNACSNQAHVQGLLDAGVDAVIATSYEIDDAVATNFAGRFYQALAGGATLQVAFDEAVSATKLERGDQPRHLYLLRPDGSRAETNVWPWRLTFRDGAEDTAHWKLPDAPHPIHTPDNFLWVGVPFLPNLDHIVGRQELLDDLVNRLRTGQSPALSTDGLPGVGKTTLAILLAHDERIRAHFTDGVLWAGLGPTPDVPSIQAAWAEALGIDLRQVADPHTRQQRLSAAVGQRRILVVIDDAWQVADAQPLRLSGPHSAHLLTTRNTTIARGFAGAAQAVKVPVLDDETAWELLQQLAPEACAADPVAARALADAVGGLPLAIELLGGYLAAPEQIIFPDLSQAALAELKNPARRLALAQERLGNATDGIQTLEAVIRLSIEDLGRVDTQAVDAFYTLGAFAPKPATFERAAAETVTGASSGTLALLVARNLLEVGQDGVLAMHQIVHDAAAKMTPMKEVASHRHYYLEQVNQDREDWQRIESIYSQVKHAWASAQPLDMDIALSFLGTIGIYQERRGLWQDRLNWATLALVLAEANGSVAESATLLNYIGLVYSDLGQKEKALEFFNQALPLVRQICSISGEAATLNNIGVVYSDLRQKEKALEFFDQALPLIRQMGDKSGEAATLNNIGSVYDALGQPEKALEFFNQALPLRCQMGDKGGEAATLNNIGSVYSDLDQKHLALDFFNQALSLIRQVGSISGEAATLNNIGSVYDALGQKEKALEFYKQALPLIHQAGSISGEATTLNNIGGVYNDLGQKEKALDFYKQVLPLVRQVGDKSREATITLYLISIHLNLGIKDGVLALMRDLYNLYTQLDPIVATELGLDPWAKKIQEGLQIIDSSDDNESSND